MIIYVFSEPFLFHKLHIPLLMLKFLHSVGESKTAKESVLSVACLGARVHVQVTSGLVYTGYGKYSHPLKLFTISYGEASGQNMF